MYKIAICDDEVIFAQSLSVTVKNVLNRLQIPFTLDIYLSCDDLLGNIQEKPEAYQLMLLDILMDGMNGLELAQKTRELNSRATIVFITSTLDYSLRGYEVGAYRYLLKPVSETVLTKILDYDYHNSVCKKFLIVRENAGFKQYEMKQISYLEICGRKVAIALSNEIVFVPAKLSELEQQLPKNEFIRCHQSFIFNINHIMELRYGEVITDNGKHLPVSRAYFQKVQKAFLKKLGE